MAYEIIEVVPRGMIYLERRCAPGPEFVGPVILDACEKLFALMSEQRVSPTGAPLAIFDGYSDGEVSFRTGFPMSDEDCRRVSDSALCGETPGGRALRGLHRGPWSGLPAAYEEMLSYLEANGLPTDGKGWEVFLTDPGQTPEDSLETEIYILV